MEDDEIEINVGKITKFFKRKKKKPEEKKEKIELKEIKAEEPREEVKTEEKTEEEISVDFRKIKKIFKKEKKPKVEIIEPEKQSREEIGFNIKGIFSFIKKYKLVLLILIPMFFSIFFRMYPAYLPATDDWARNSVYNNIQASIRNQIDQQYPNLPDTNKDALVNEQLQEFIKQNNADIESQIQQTSTYFKSRFKDEQGQTYLLAIDPWLWYGEARNYLNYGQFGDKIVDGKDVYSLRNGREGKVIGRTVFNQVFEVNLYKFLHFFNRNISLMFVCFITPVIIITLSIIPAFFIGRKIGGNVGGFFAAMIIAVNSALLGRTPAGFADTDPYNILFPLLIAWMFIESFEAKETKKTIIFASLAALFIGIYSRAWSGWSFVVNFMLLSLFVCFIYYTITYRKLLKQSIVRFFKNKQVREIFIIAGLIIILSMCFVSLFRGGVEGFTRGITGPLRFAKIKDVATATLWPNVFTTVAEFNEVDLANIMSQMGGRFLFIIACIGIILTLTKRNKEGKVDIKYASFLTIWFIGTTYAFTKGTRFSLLLVPAFAIAFGLAIGIGESYISRWMSREMHLNKKLSKAIVIGIFLLLLIGPIKSANSVAKQEIPSMTDAWYESLTAIRDNETDAIITSWWDFGHWFVAVSERKVTFDGADQGRRIHWVGKSLLTSDENQAIGILRMLNCGQEKAFDVLDNYTDDVVKSIDILNEIILVERTKAKDILLKNKLTSEQAEEVLALTHCPDLIPQFYITSDDMIGKASVWSHFGSWDFRRSKMWNTVRGKTDTEGIRILKEEFNLSEEDADRIYYEIQTNEADRWITGWYGYRSGLDSCNVNNNQITCGNGLIVNLETEEATFITDAGEVHPTTFVYATKDNVVEKKYTDNTVPYSAALIPDGNSYKSVLMDPPLAASMFTRLYFFEGHGLEHFILFSDRRSVIGQNILVWKASFESGEKIIMEEFKPKSVKEGSKVTVNYIGWSEDETVFDSNIIGWEEKAITKDSEFLPSYTYTPFTFEVGAQQVIVGFEEGIKGMMVNDEREIEIPPELGYGLDPTIHPLANKTLYFKIKVLEIS